MRHRKDWSAEDIKMLHALYIMDVSRREIAKSLGRTVKAIGEKLLRLGITGSKESCDLAIAAETTKQRRHEAQRKRLEKEGFFDREKTPCIRCGSEETVCGGKSNDGAKQRYLCRACGYHFTENPEQDMLHPWTPEYKKEYYARYTKIRWQQIKASPILLQKHRESFQRWYRNHASEQRARIVRYVKEHPEVSKAYRASPQGRFAATCASQHRRALKRSAIGNGLDVTAFEEKWERQRGHCFYCDRKMKRGGNNFDPLYVTQDHKVALSKDGQHTPDNIVLACRECNDRKFTASVEEFQIRNGRLPLVFQEALA